MVVVMCGRCEFGMVVPFDRLPHPTTAKNPARKRETAKSVRVASQPGHLP
jgi:hypothetical protein